MRITSWLYGACLSACVSAGALGQTLPVPHSIERYIEPGVPYTSLWLPSPLNPPSLRNLVNRLGLSEAQAAFAENLYGEYVEQWNEAASRLLPALLEASSAAAQQAGLTAEYAHNLSLAEDVRTQIARILRQREDVFFDGLVPVLTPDQESRLSQVRLDRRRQHCAAATETLSLPVFAVELRSVLRGLDLVDVEREVLQQIEALLDEHERTMTTSMCELSEAIRARVETWDLLAERSELSRAGDAQNLTRADEISRKIDRIHHRIARAAGQVREQNEKRLEGIRTLLPERIAEDLEREYRKVAYPRAFDRGDDLYDLFTRLVDSEGLVADERTTVDMLRREYLRRDRAILRGMENELVRWSLAPFQVDSGALAVHRRTLDRLTDDRNKLAAEQPTALEGLLGDRWGELAGAARRSPTSE